MAEYTVQEFRYRPFDRSHLDKTTRSAAIPRLSLAPSEVCISILPPGQVDVHFVPKSTFIDVNVAAAPTSFAINSDKLVSSVVPPSSYGFVTQGTDFKIISHNHAPCVLLEIGDQVYKHWLEGVGIDPASPQAFDEYRVDPAMGSFGQLTTTLFQEIGAAGGAVDIMAMEAMVLGMSGRLLGSFLKKENDDIDQMHRLLSNKDNRLVRSVDYTMTHLSNPELKVADLAAEANMSVQHYSEMFKQWKGVSPYAFIRSERLRLASHLLKTTKTPIATIAYETGFSSQAHLTTAFKAAFGITPGLVRA